jgi:hypothetical protein
MWSNIMEKYGDLYGWFLISGVNINRYCLGVVFGVGPNFSRACVTGAQGKGCKKMLECNRNHIYVV